MLVVNEPELAAAIERLEGEWAEREGGTLRADSRPWAEIANSSAIDADLIVFPTRYLGELATRGWLRPVRRNVLEGDTFASADMFPLVRRDLVTWGGQVMAVAIGVDLPTSGLLAAAAPATVSNDRLGVLFDPETMRPRITEPAFVEALIRLAEGQQVEATVPVLGLGDRLVGVSTASRNAASAFKLLAWLASAEISSQLAPADGGTLPVRRSLATSPAWFGADVKAGERENRGKLVLQLLSGERCLLIPRIPGIDEYLAVLEEGVAKSDNPSEALRGVAAQWEAITERLGRDKQRAAYLKHLNVTEP